MAHAYCISDQFGNSFGDIYPLPPSANLQCSFITTNTTQVEPCCKGAVQHFHTCISYCEPKASDLQGFLDCVSGGKKAGELTNYVSCQRNIKSTIINSLTQEKANDTGQTKKGSGGGTSFGIRGASTPKVSTILVVAILASFFFAAPASASIFSSLDSIGVSRRSASSCTFVEDSHYNKTGRSLVLSPVFDCPGGPFCSYGVPIDTGMKSNNRTLNGTSAADTKYDRFFEMLSTSVTPKRAFPAMSGTSLVYDWAALDMAEVGWTVLQYCVNGTAKGCAGVLGDYNGPWAVEACGPVFSDGTGLGDNPIILGVLTAVSVS